MYRNVLCLVLGLVIGIRLTDLFDYLRLTDSRDYALTQAPAATPQVHTETKTETEADIAAWLFNETRVLCLVLTIPQWHHRKAAKVKNTWGSRCNKLIFLSSEEDKELGAIDVGVPEDRKNLYAKVRAGFAYAYKHHGEDYDWFLKADDDTFIIMENLRYFLYPYDPEAALYFGHKFHTDFPQGYMSGGAGYVLSRDALRRLNLFALNNTRFCPENTLSEDRQIGNCLRNVGVVAGDSRDEEGQERFLPLSPKHLVPHFPTTGWLSGFVFYKPTETCCSTTAISYHYVKDFEFEIYEYLLYRLRVFGIPVPLQKLPPRLGFREMHSLLRYWSQVVSDNLEKPGA
ncbi:glycoprotein-N-acetylgalactosamine 3-beta-galactosyltransferase 1-like isoform X2 [Drosophila miranda]|uniref:glycoprotein-N-acetylgalactosamine 3-beta-galactosyltransferase 1-like isoform X2 n=1 Tax=Drosophila miranda TaxID=7229 RepID=UPI00143F1CBA|nr:glycoprotein-N-acetylgalactosamine 3-beta-galactosyltransferase 1-like isoform X2 [Drosophila miranda]